MTATGAAALERTPLYEGNVSECAMSALGQKQTLDCRPLMSAIHPQADMDGYSPNVRFVPKADISIASANRKVAPPGGLSETNNRTRRQVWLIAANKAGKRLIG